jgi:hypothetical protein
MPPRIPVHSLLSDPAGGGDTTPPVELLDVRLHLIQLASVLNTSHPGPIQVPLSIAEQLSNVLLYLRSLTLPPSPSGFPMQLTSPHAMAVAPSGMSSSPSIPNTPSRNSSISDLHGTPSREQGTTLPPASMPEITYNIRLNRQTVLSALYRYDDIQACVEYPKTSPPSGDPVGYLFRRDPQHWENLSLNFAYSLGKPSGWNKEIYFDLLCGANGAPVPCIENHSTCICLAF